jgi:hypothetical protein
MLNSNIRLARVEAVSSNDGSFDSEEEVDDAESQIEAVATFDSSKDDHNEPDYGYENDDNNDQEIGEERVWQKRIRKRKMKRRDSTIFDHGIDFSLFKNHKEIASQIFYVSTFAILGTALRVYMGRLFGTDCIRAAGDGAVQDFFTPLSSKICVTSDGRTQRGGAMFVDLPTNMLGS